jgi:uncharacterized protein (UPF0335 family)
MTESTAPDEIKAFFERWLRLEEEKKVIGDDLKELFKESSSRGYGSKELRTAFRRKIKEDEANPADAEFEAVVDIYLDALNAPKSSPRDARMRTRENVEEFDAETGDINPRFTKQIVDGMQTEAGRAALVAAVDIMIEGEEAEEQNLPETATKQRVNGHSQHEGANAQATVHNEVVTVVGTERGTVAIPDPSAAGGDYVTAEANKGLGLVKVSETRQPLRPNCLRPGQPDCGGYGDKTCHACLVAARNTGEAA